MRNLGDQLNTSEETFGVMSGSLEWHVHASLITRAQPSSVIRVEKHAVAFNELYP